MFDYAVCQIKGKQYKIIPGQAFRVGLVADKKEDVEAEVLLRVQDGKVEIGTPILKDKLILKNLGIVAGEKIRAAKFHAKANYRRVTGLRPKFTEVVYSVK